jgi:hypothetical protein
LDFYQIAQLDITSAAAGVEERKNPGEHFLKCDKWSNTPQRTDWYF